MERMREINLPIRDGPKYRSIDKPMYRSTQGSRHRSTVGPRNFGDGAKSTLQRLVRYRGLLASPHRMIAHPTEEITVPNLRFPIGRAEG
jgi:hypothetical protein